ncbi:MAG: lytic transglycosylase [Actinomycetota bacterium]
MVLGLSGLADAAYTVARGDSLSKIASKYGVSMRAIAAANGIRNVNLIRVGRLLQIPGGVPPVTPVGLAGPAQGTIQHRVAPGENLTRIASRYRTTVQNLVALNQIKNPSLVRVGQMLNVPAPAVLKVAGAPPQAAPPVIPPAASIPVPVLPPALPAKPPVTTVPSALPAGVEDLIQLYSEKYGVQPALMKGLAWQESGWKQHVVSSAGAIGIMQVMPQTGEFISRQLLKEPVNLNDREQNVKAGIRFFAYYLSKTGGDERTAVAGYFQGLRSVWQNGVSPGTQRYVNSVMALRDRFNK